MIETKRLLIRKFDIKDSDDCFEWMSDRDTCYMDGGYEPWLEKNDSFCEIMNRFSCQEGRWMIELKAEKKVIGTIFIRNAVFRVCNAREVGYVLNPRYRRCGYMKEALEGVISMLEDEDVELLCAKVFEKNIPSLSFVKSLGFIEEGRLVKSFKHPILGIGDLVSFYREFN